MRTRILILFLLSSLMGEAFTLDRTETDELTAAAEAAYAAGDPTLALLLFDSIRQEYTSAGLHLNIGNCYYKLGDVPRAILHYERSLKLEPSAEDVQANLELVRQQLTDRVNELPGFALGNTWGRLRGGEDVDQWSRRSLWACLALFAALAIAALFRSNAMKKLFFGLAAVCFVLSVIAVVFATARHVELMDDSEAIIMTPKVEVRSEPNEGATVLFVLHKGTKVSLEQEREIWIEVMLPNGSVGWMPQVAMERI